MKTNAEESDSRLSVYLGCPFFSALNRIPPLIVNSETFPVRALGPRPAGLFS